MINLQFDSEYNSQNESSSILNNLEPMERITYESNYIKENIAAFQFIRKRNYLKAIESYKNCVNIAKKLEDNYKIRDSICNYAISLYYNGKLEQSLEHLKLVYEQTLKETHKIIDTYGCFEDFNEGDYIENFENVLDAFEELTWEQFEKSCYQKDPDSEN